MSKEDYRRYYYLEQYLFSEVARRFRRDRKLSAFDFFCIVIWKANRSKSKIARLLLSPGQTLQQAVSLLTSEIAGAKSGKHRMAILIDGWSFRLPMASAILTVLYPRSFTVYDDRVCGVLSRFKSLKECRKSALLWPAYLEYIGAVKSHVTEILTLRDKDRWLWGLSFHQALNADIATCFEKKKAGV